MSYLSIILVAALLIAASVQSHADSLDSGMCINDVPPFTYSPPEGEVAQASVEQCLKTYNKCNLSYQQYPKTLAKIERVSDGKVEDSYDECISDKFSHIFRCPHWIRRNTDIGLITPVPISPHQHGKMMTANCQGSVIINTGAVICPVVPSASR